ncbi:MAG: XisI protein [Anaerolineae bacterium]|nr:XisI protein [Anaerolineae bacterium]
MNDTPQLIHIVQYEVDDYAKGTTFGGITYPISDAERQTYSVIIVPDVPRKYKAGVVVVARVLNDKVIIDEDITDRPLWEELVRAGIPREQIILAYAGEKAPEPPES